MSYERETLVAELRERGVAYLAPSDALSVDPPPSDGALILALLEQSDARLRMGLVPLFIRHPALAADVERLVADATGWMGGVDVLVNNAGIGGPRAALEDISYEDWDRTITVNLNGMFYCIKNVAPLMKAQNSGCIVNISTASAKVALPLRSPYVASKVAVLGLTHTVAREYGPFGIRCNAILPGLIDNARGRNILANHAKEKGVSFEEAERDFLEFISLRTWIDPTEVGDLAVFLASPAGRHITGQDIGMDGNVEWEI